MFLIGQAALLREEGKISHQEACIIVSKSEEDEYLCLFEDMEVEPIDKKYLTPVRLKDKFYLGKFCTGRVSKSLSDSFIERNIKNILKEIKLINHEKDRS